jgi:hypothetical protein
MSAATASILDAMRATGTSRLVVISAAPVASDDHGTTLPHRLLARPLLRGRCCAAYTPTWPRWRRPSGAAAPTGRSCARPSSPTGPGPGTYRQAKDRNLRGGARICRADLADAILASLDDPDTVKATIAIGY